MLLLTLGVRWVCVVYAFRRSGREARTTESECTECRGAENYGCPLLSAMRAPFGKFQTAPDGYGWQSIRYWSAWKHAGTRDASTAVWGEETPFCPLRLRRTRSSLGGFVEIDYVLFSLFRGWFFDFRAGIGLEGLRTGTGGCAALSGPPGGLESGG